MWSRRQCRATSEYVTRTSTAAAVSNQQTQEPYERSEPPIKRRRRSGRGPLSLDESVRTSVFGERRADLVGRAREVALRAGSNSSVRSWG